jgi:hypothetical protein
MVAVGVQSLVKPAKMKTNKQQSLFFFFNLSFENPGGKRGTRRWMNAEDSEEEKDGERVGWVGEDSEGRRK